MTGDDLKQAVFGASDGATTTLGIVGATWFAGHHGAVLIAVIGAALASTIGMAGSEFLSDGESSLRRAGVMGAATMVGSVFPALPFMFGHGSVTLAVCAAAALALGGLVAWVRARTTGWTLAVAQVYGIFVVVSALTTIAGVIAPGPA